MIKKLRRMLESILPVDDGRRGKCRGCGACCRLPVKCMFLTKDNRCRIYALRPIQCRKFPRTRHDHREVSSCGFRWKLKKEAG